MNKSASLFILLLAAGCQAGPLNVLYKEGSTRPERQQAYDQCTIEALKQVPQNMVTEISGGDYMPGFIQCNTDKNNHTYCGEVGGYTTPVTSTSYDTNQALRDRVINRCLAEKGYSVIVRPLCETKEQRAAAATLVTQPPQESLSCVAGQSFTPL